MTMSFDIADVLPLLLDCTLKATILGAGAMVVLQVPAARRASAAARHLVLTLTLAGMLLLPVLSAALPGWEVLPQWVPQATTARGAADVSTPRAAEFAASWAAPEVGVPAAEAPAQGWAGPPVTAAESAPPASAAPRAWSKRTWLGMAYLTGLVLTFIPVALAGFLLLRLRLTTPAAGPAMAGVLDELRKVAGVRGAVRLLQSPGNAMPMTWGGWANLFPACILLPADAERWPATRLRCVLLHELAHIARRDALTLFLARVACAAYWFHPLAWLLAARLRVEAEQACDDRVLATAGRGAEPIKPSTYAAELFALAGAPAALRPARLPGLAAIAMARPHRPSQLHARLKSILDTAGGRRSLTRSTALLLCALLASTVLVLAAARAQANDEGLGPAGAWATARGFLAQKIEETTLDAGWGRPGWRNLPFRLTPEEEKAARECVEIAVRVPATVNGVNKPSAATREALEAILAKHPNYFYAEFLLAQWHRASGNAAEADRLLAASYEHAPAILVQPFARPDGTPLAGAAVQTMEIECNRVQNGSIDQSLNLRFRDLRTDAHGNLYLPVYQTVYRRSGISYPQGYTLDTGKLGFFETSRKVGVMPVAVAKPKAGAFVAQAAPDAPPVATVTLPGDVRVEVVAVGREPGAADAYWRPDGSPAPAVDVSHRPGVSPWPEETGRRFMLRFSKALPADSHLQFAFSDPVSAQTHYTTVRPQDVARPLSVFAAFPTQPERTSIRIAVASGDWQAWGIYHVATRETAGALPEGCAIKPEDGGGVPRFGLECPPMGDLQYRLVAFDAAGSPVVGEQGGIQVSSGVQTLFYRFPKVPAGGIRSVRVETRRYESAEFSNIALQPRGGNPATRPAATRPVTLSPAEPTLLGAWARGEGR